MSFKGQLLKAGISSNGKDVVIFHEDGTFTVKGDFILGSSSAPLTLSPASDRALEINTTCALTSGTIRSVDIDQTQTASGAGIFEVLRASLNSEYRTGSWANAIVGRIDYGSTGDSAGGMAAAICGEINLAAKDMHNLGGGYYAFDAEINVPTGCTLMDTVATRPVAFFNLAAWGGAVGEFDDKGFLFHTDGLTAGAGHLLSANTRTLRVNIGGTTRYLYLSDTEDDLGAMVMDSVTFSDGGTITDASDVMTLTDETITLAGSTAINLDGDVTITGAVELDGTGDITMRSGATIANASKLVITEAAGITLSGDIDLTNGATIVDASANDGELTITQDGIILVGGGYSKIQFGGVTDWGTGATGTVIDGTGWDWVTQTVGVVNSGALATACAAAYHALTVAPASHSTASSFFGTWTELYLQATQDMSNANNVAAVWGQIEAGATVTTTDVSDCFLAAGYFNLISGATFVIQSGIAVNGVRVQSEVATSGFSNSGRFAAFEALKKSGCQDWEYGLYLADAGTAIDTGTCAIVLDAQPAIAATGKAIYVAGTVTDPGASDGHIAYLDVTYSGNQAGLGRNVGIWTNFAEGSTIDSATIVLDVGVYDGSTNGVTGDVYLLNLDFQIAAGSNPGRLGYIRTNSNQAGTDPDYMIAAANDEALCLTLSDPGTTFAGYIKVFSGTSNKEYAIPLVAL